MATLVVGSVTVQVANGDLSEKYEPIGGEVVRMFDGSARSTVRSYKRSWTFTSTLLDSTAAAALKAALVTTTLPVSCSGDITGSVSCIPRITEYAPVRTARSLRRRVSFTLTEV